MSGEWDEKTLRVIDLLSDKKWHDLDEIEEIISLPDDECNKVLKLIEEAGILEIKRKDGEISKIRGTQTLKNIKNLPEEK